MNTLIVIGLFIATVIVGELRHRYQESITADQLERHIR